jgi:DNA replication protein DnaC
VKLWRDVIGDPTLGDAILDRLVHNARRLRLSGESSVGYFSNFGIVSNSMSPALW